MPCMRSKATAVMQSSMRAAASHLCKGVHDEHIHVQEDDVTLVCHALCHESPHEGDLRMQQTRHSVLRA